MGWAGLGLGDLLLATVFPLVMRKAFGSTAGAVAMVLALGIMSGLLVLVSFGTFGEGFPVMVALGPAIVLQHGYWLRRQGAERTMWQYRQEGLLPRRARELARAKGS